MNNKNITYSLLGVLAVVAIVVAAYLYMEDRLKKERIKQLEEDRLKLILDSINQNHDLSNEVKRQLENLISEFVKIDQNIASELTQALQLFHLGQIENAIEDIVKIIGYLLEQYYSNQEAFKDWCQKEKKNRKHIDVHDLLTYCHKVDKKIDEIEYQFFLAIKTIRNKEAHEVNLKLDKYLTASGIITAIGAIVKITKIVYPSSLAVNSQDVLPSAY